VRSEQQDALIFNQTFSWSARVFEQTLLGLARIARWLDVKGSQFQLLIWQVTVCCQARSRTAHLAVQMEKSWLATKNFIVTTISLCQACSPITQSYCSVHTASQSPTGPFYYILPYACFIKPEYTGKQDNLATCNTLTQSLCPEQSVKDVS
jgi:hypothetical protein